MIKITLASLLTLLFSSPAFAAFAQGSKVLVGYDMKSIETFVVGDQVTIMDSGSGPGDISLSEERVAFSAGTGSKGHQPAMIYLHYGTEGDNLIVTPDQIFLTYSQKFVEAHQLKPGDQLLTKDGSPASVTNIVMGEYNGGVHSIAPESDSTMANCLIVNGVWVGSYKLGIFYDMANLKDANIFQDQPLR